MLSEHPGHAFEIHLLPLAGWFCAKPEGVRGRIMEAGSLKAKAGSEAGKQISSKLVIR